MSIVVADLLFGALSEIRVARAGDSLEPEAQALALSLLNEFFDLMNAEGRALYSQAFFRGTLTVNHQPHTIGLSTNTPTPDFAVAVGRPTKIIGIPNIILANNIRSPLDPISQDEWMAIPAGAATGSALTITTSVPSRMFYSADWPNGSIYLYPPPNTAYGLEAVFETLLAAVVATDLLDLPMGYQAAVRYSLAEICVSHFGGAVWTQTQQSLADKARGIAWGNNDLIPRLRTRDAGMPGGRRQRGAYNYRTGMGR